MNSKKVFSNSKKELRNFRACASFNHSTGYEFIGSVNVRLLFELLVTRLKKLSKLILERRSRGSLPLRLSLKKDTAGGRLDSYPRDATVIEFEDTCDDRAHNFFVVEAIKTDR